MNNLKQEIYKLCRSTSVAAPKKLYSLTTEVAVMFSRYANSKESLYGDKEPDEKLFTYFIENIYNN